MFAAGLALATSLAGCPVDNRKLEPAAEFGGQAGAATFSQPSAGTDSGAGAAAGGTTQVGDGGAVADTAGASGEGSARPLPTVGGCADLDTNGIADCKETIVTNPDFKQDVSGWVAEADATLMWDPLNAVGDPPSGSALVASTGVIDADASGAALRAASQCVPIAGKQLVTAYANAFVDAGQDADGKAEVDVFFFDAANCQGTFAGSFSTPQPTDGAAGSWLTLLAGSVSSEAVKSALVKLAISKPFRAASFQARFDNVLVKVQSAP
jgi:hypothetical protein